VPPIVTELEKRERQNVKMTVENVDVSIIIVTYNGRDITLKTLDSFNKAVAADERNRYEMIIVDNASQDGVADAVEEMHPHALVVRNPTNVGFSKANNIGYAHTSSRGRYILFSNPDIEVTEETLPTLVRLMDENPNVGASTPFLKQVKTGDIDWGAHRGFPTPWAAFTYFAGFSRLFKRSRRLSSIFGNYHLLDQDLTVEHPVDAIRGGFFFVRRKAFAEAGCWDEDYFMFGEDLDLCYQIKRRGLEIMFYPQALALHYHGMTTGLKRHSQNITPVDAEARERTYNAFYDAMKIFYDKNYRTKYGRFTKSLVMLAIEMKRALGRKNLTV
jgi:GT2 family glycosyltransferase